MLTPPAPLRLLPLLLLLLLLLAARLRLRRRQHRHRQKQQAWGRRRGPAKSLQAWGVLQRRPALLLLAARQGRRQAPLLRHKWRLARSVRAHVHLGSESGAQASRRLAHAMRCDAWLRDGARPMHMRGQHAAAGSDRAVTGSLHHACTPWLACPQIGIRRMQALALQELQQAAGKPGRSIHGSNFSASATITAAFLVYICTASRKDH